jgi:ribosomal protein L11 methyltransferase
MPVYRHSSLPIIEMASNIELTITVSDKQQQEILIAQLEQAGATGFEEGRGWLKAFVPESDYRPVLFKEIIEIKNLKYTESIIKDKNWNAEWESGFSPVIIHDFCAIRASFHEAVPGVQHDIVITPKMSFGTGHHATTHMMVEAMAGIDFKAKQVLDFGTGTGVLAILAEKLGAAGIDAIDNDDWSIENAMENFNSNNSHKSLLIKADSIVGDKVYDVILANINRNIILENMAAVKQHLAPAGVVLFSGLLTGDEPVIVEAAGRQQLDCNGRLLMNGWICLLMVNRK